MTRQRDHSAIIRGLTHADTYIGEGSERDAGITLGPPFSARNPPLRQLRDQCIWLTVSGFRRLVRHAKTRQGHKVTCHQSLLQRIKYAPGCLACVDFIDLIPVHMARATERFASITD
jgi:hypothetical protein